jgi:hypothetical protein
LFHSAKSSASPAGTRKVKAWSRRARAKEAPSWRRQACPPALNPLQSPALDPLRSPAPQPPAKLPRTDHLGGDPGAVGGRVAVQRPRDALELGEHPGGGAGVRQHQVDGAHALAVQPQVLGVALRHQDLEALQRGWGVDCGCVECVAAVWSVVVMGVGLGWVGWGGFGARCGCRGAM